MNSDASEIAVKMIIRAEALRNRMAFAIAAKGWTDVS
jgi:hypothetical protein